MDYALKYRLFPNSQQREQLDWVRDTVRQLYNHALHRFNRIPESAGTVKQRVQKARDEIPALKDWWTDLTNVYSTVLQQAVEQIATNIENLGKLERERVRCRVVKLESTTRVPEFHVSPAGFRTR